LQNTHITQSGSAEILSLLRSHECDKYIISLSHDDPISISGGTQEVIRREMHIAQSKGVCYIHASPAKGVNTNLPSIVNISINGSGNWQATLEALIYAIQRVGSSFRVLTVHHLHGFKPRDLMPLFLSAKKFDVRLFWLHDYYTSCHQYNLIDSSGTFCQSPPPHSETCRLCLHSKDREAHLHTMRTLTKTAGFKFVFPSSASKRLILGGYNSLPEKGDFIVEPLATISNLETGALRAYSAGDPYRVAFIGMQLPHKGWNEYVELSLAEELNGKFQWFQFGHGDIHEQIKLVKVSGLQRSSNEMIDKLSAERIDLAFFWPHRPETFCLAALEAIQAGCHVISSDRSGNILDLLPSSVTTVLNTIDKVKSFLLGLCESEQPVVLKPTNVEVTPSELTFQLLTSSNNRLIDTPERTIPAERDIISEPSELCKAAEKLINMGRYNDAKKVLLKELRNANHETSLRIWMNLSKCLFYQYQLAPALHFIEKCLKSIDADKSLRLSINELAASIQDALEYQSQLCHKFIKPTYYQSQVNDSNLALDSSHECYRHYQLFGAKAFIKPAPWFDTKYYLYANMDIKRAGVCPFFHFLAAGIKEGRMSTQLSEKYAREVALQASLPQDLFEEARAWTQPQVSSRKLNTSSLVGLVSSLNKFVLSISHDQYYKVPGGIQLCIKKEQEAYNKAGVNYLHVCSKQPLPMSTSDYNPNLRLVLSIDGEQVGECSISDLFAIIKRIPPSSVIIHSLLGLSPKVLSDQMIGMVDTIAIYMWIHDFSTICTSYQLLRNKVSFCGGPHFDSRQCVYCYFGSSRSDIISPIHKLFECLMPTIVFPSKSAKAVWLESNSSYINPRHTIVHPHIVINKYEMNVRDLAGRLPRLAFLGHPTYPKGWDHFTQIAMHQQLFTFFELYHFGATQSNFRNELTFVKVDVSSDPNAMTEALKSQEIDFVLIWPQWPETFCITAYEAIIAGCRLITHSEAGNVTDFASENTFAHLSTDSSIEGLFSILHDIKTRIETVGSMVFPANVSASFSLMTAELDGVAQ
jgi:hypothetical protein